MKLRKINRFEIICLVLLLPFFPLQSITMLSEYNDIWTSLYNVIAIARCFIALSQIGLFCLEFRKPNVLTKSISAFEFSIFLACIINGSITFQFVITNCLVCIGFSCMIQRLHSKNEEVFINAAIKLFGFFTIVGALSIFIFPNGFNNSTQKQFAIYFIGTKNSAFFYYALFIFLSIVKYKKRKVSISQSLIGLTLILMISTLVCDSMNGFLMLFLILIFLIIDKYKIPFRTIFKPKFVLSVVIALAVSIPFIATGKFDWFFNLLGRESNFSMRTFVWQSAIDFIYLNPFWGNGKDGDLVYYGRQTHAHDIYLDYASKYGLVTLTVFVIVIVVISKRISECKNKDYRYMCSFFLLVMLVHSLFDVVSIPILSLMFLFCIKEPIYLTNKQALISGGVQ